MSDEKDEASGFRVTDRRGEVKTEAAPEKKPETPPPGSSRTHHPRIDFATFVLSLSTSAFVHLGLVEDPHTGKKEKNLELARQEIDILEMLSEKTKGNLTESETKIMSEVLYQLRLNFVEQTKP